MSSPSDKLCFGLKESSRLQGDKELMHFITFALLYICEQEFSMFFTLRYDDDC